MSAGSIGVSPPQSVSGFAALTTTNGSPRMSARLFVFVNELDVSVAAALPTLTQLSVFSTKAGRDGVDSDRTHELLPRGGDRDRDRGLCDPIDSALHPTELVLALTTASRAAAGGDGRRRPALCAARISRFEMIFAHSSKWLAMAAALGFVRPQSHLQRGTAMHNEAPALRSMAYL